MNSRLATAIATAAWNRQKQCGGATETQHLQCQNTHQQRPGEQPDHDRQRDEPTLDAIRWAPIAEVGSR
jgi:hypothetical protein